MRHLRGFIAVYIFLGAAHAAGAENFSDAVQAALPGIVNITVWRKDPVAGAPVPDEGPEHLTAIVGSGFIVDASGIIVTNRHVVEGASTISIGFNDRSRARAKVLAIASVVDIAILKVDVPRPLLVLRFGDSDQLRVGQPVICVGNPLGIGLTATSGVISALNRDIHTTPFDEFIQSDCAINPGNSGGPMLNTKGEVVGLDTANVDPYNAGSIGLGFALTSNDVAFAVPRLIRTGHVATGWIGVSMQEVTPEMAEALALPDHHGFIIRAVDPGGPGERMGPREGDVLMDFAGALSSDVRTLIRAIARIPVGGEIVVSVWRAGKASRVVLPVAEFPSRAMQIDPPVDEPPPQLANLGFKVESILNPPAAQGAGVVVTDVVDDSIASEAGIFVGSIILRMQETAVGTQEDVTRVLDEARASHRRFVVLLLRDKAKEQRWLWLRL